VVQHTNMGRPVPRRRATFIWWSGWLLLAVTALTVAAVGSIALWFQANPAFLWIGLWIASLIGALAVALRNGPMSGLGLVLAATSVFALWWMTILPSNGLNWQPDVSEILTGEFDPDDASREVLHNVRNFDWQTPTEAKERWEAREYDLDALESLDFILTWWAGPAIAHTMVSFGFSDGEHIDFSLGIRPERDEAYWKCRGIH
jgi:hypothetical protein